MKGLFISAAITLASVVFPTPGGPQRIMEGIPSGANSLEQDSVFTQ
jgi:hypothetical protein